MKTKTTATALSLALAFSLATLLSATPALAASAGRISGRSFRSSSSYSRSSRSPSFGSSRSSSPSYRASPSPVLRSTPAPGLSRSPSYYGGSPSKPYRTTLPYSNPGNNRTNIIVMPDMTPNVYPVAPPLYSSQVAPVPQTPVSPAFFFVLLAVLGVGGLAIFLLAGGWEDFVSPWVSTQRDKLRKTTVVRQRVALLASAKDLQTDLIRLARRGDTDSPEGLSKILQETSLALLRHPDKVVYAWSSTEQVASGEAESRFDQLSMEERSKASEEVLTNVGGSISERKVKPQRDVTENEYILVSVLVASDRKLDLKLSDSHESLNANLVTLGSVSPEDLVALEVIWQPEDEFDVLSKDELLSLYPDLNVL